MPDAGTLILVAALCMAGGFIGGIVGVGGGVLFVPTMAIFLDMGQVEAEATSLLMIIIVALAGAARQRHYGNVRLRDAAWVAALSPLGVAAGVIVANLVPERALELAFAALCLFIAYELIRGARKRAGSGGAPRPPVVTEPISGPVVGDRPGRESAFARPPADEPGADDPRR